MKSLKPKSFFRCLLAIVLLSNACSDKNGLNSGINLNLSQKSNFVTESSALEYAQDINLNTQKSTARKTHSQSTLGNQEVVSSKRITDKDGLPALYIISYRGGGFVIISADKRTEPILAFSKTSTFPTDSLPAGLTMWLSESKGKIEKIRDENIEYKGQDSVFRVTYQDKILNGSQSISPMGVQPPPDPCTDLYFVKEPMLSTTWNQIGGYNNFMPALSCVPFGNNGRAYTGCVATAMAQVIRYHQYPTSYDYSIMPNAVEYYDTSNGANEISRLMYATAQSVNSNYNCNGTGAAADMNDVEVALENTFGYSSTVNDAAYNYNTIKNELAASRPVIVSGYPDANSSGHMWVIDGYRNYQMCNASGSGRDSYLYFHMNWGWGGRHDGWFGFDSADSGNGNYNYNKRMVHGIKKP